jgi:hypothetical protein
LTSIALIFIGFKGLHIWKLQEKAKIKTQFLFDLITVANNYIQAMGSPITHVGIIEIGIRSHSENPESNDSQNTNNELINFIKKGGKIVGKELCEHLKTVKPIYEKLESLSVIGQTLGFKDYHKCYNACQFLIHSYKQIESMSYILQDTNLVWNNPAVIIKLKEFNEIKSAIIKSNMEDNNLILLEFNKSFFNNVFER